VFSEDEVFGEAALFLDEVRSATVRALGEVRVLTADKETLLGRVRGDSSLAFRRLQKMSDRIKAMDEQMMKLKSAE